LQDNGSWGGPSQTRSNAGITNADWFRTGGGDGFFYSQADPNDPFIIYSESQNGAMQSHRHAHGPQHQHPSAHCASAVAQVWWRRRCARSALVVAEAVAVVAAPVAKVAQLRPASPTASPDASPQDPQAALAAFAAQQGFGVVSGGAALASNVVPAPGGDRYVSASTGILRS